MRPVPVSPRTHTFMPGALVSSPKESAWIASSCPTTRWIAVTSSAGVLAPDPPTRRRAPPANETGPPPPSRGAAGPGSWESSRDHGVNVTV